MMYLQKVEGPRSVTLPDGSILSRADLPPEDTQRWVASRKVTVVRGVLYGLITLSEVKQKYGVSEEEFSSWATAVVEHGADALKVTSLKKYRQPQVE